MTGRPRGKPFTSRPIEERFWEKVDRRGPDECWPWLAANARGYGLIWVGGGRTVIATHLSWEWHNGRPFPDGMDACHSCDNPSCVNPRHIWPGTASDNALDMVAKGRNRPNPEAISRYRTGRYKTHCIRGHELSGDNVKSLGFHKGRCCMTCKRLYAHVVLGRRRVAAEES